MLNMFIVKKYTALVLSGTISTTLFFIGMVYYGVIGGVGFLLVGLLLCVLMGTLLLKNPFSQLLEGKGILTLNIDSTGVIRPFIIAVAPPFIKGMLRGKPVNDAFDRKSVFNLAVPKKIKKPAKQTNEGGIKIELDNDTYNRARFALFHYPVLIYNEQVQSVLTKDFLAEQETSFFAEHTILYLNRKVEELSNYLLNFGRYLIEQLKPKQSLLGNKWFWIILVIIGIILAALFVPAIMQAIQGFSNSATTAVGTAAKASGGTITPR